MNIDSVVTVKPNPNIPDIIPGDTVRVSARIKEGDKERIQVFQGVVIKIQRGGAGASFTVRRIAYGVGVERTFPVYSPMIEKVEVVRHGKVRRAKLYYLRGLSGKASRIKEKRVARVIIEGEEQPQELLETPVEPAPEQPVAEITAPPVAQNVPQPSAQATEQPAAQKTEPAAAEKKP